MKIRRFLVVFLVLFLLGIGAMRVKATDIGNTTQTTENENKENPTTGSALPYITLISFTLIGGGLILITRDTRVMNRL